MCATDFSIGRSADTLERQFTPARPLALNLRAAEFAGVVVNRIAHVRAMSDEPLLMFWLGSDAAQRRSLEPDSQG